MTRPIVLGAGPAGSVAAAQLARAGAEPILIDRDREVGDAICGGFLSWRTVAALRDLGCDPATLGAKQVTRLRLFAGERMAEAALPEPAFGLSRHALDTALRNLACENGAELQIDRARHLVSGLIEGERQEWRSDAIFLATGKHDVRGKSRPRDSSDPTLGLRTRISSSPDLERLIGETIELHLFRGGYAGIVLQEGGSANVCLAVRKSMLAGAGGDPRALLTMLAANHPHFARRMAFSGADRAIDTIAAVPYGWIAQDTADGIYRVGDQAAVIPSLAGEGMSIAVASGRLAAEAYLAGRAACDYQQDFARRAARPVRVAETLWHTAETWPGAAAITIASRFVPALAGTAMRWSRI